MSKKGNIMSKAIFFVNSQPTEKDYNTNAFILNCNKFERIGFGGIPKKI
jgi:hypothetical protein